MLGLLLALATSSIPIIQSNTIGWSCGIDEICFSYNINIIPLTNEIIKAESVFEPADEGMVCSSPTNTHTLKYYNGSSYVNVTSLTDVKLISGNNPQQNIGNSPNIGCNFDSPAQWTIQVLENLDCQTILFQDFVNNKIGGSSVGYFDIDVFSENCFLKPEFDIITGISTEATTTGSIIINDQYKNYLNSQAQLYLFLIGVILFLLVFLIFL